MKGFTFVELVIGMALMITLAVYAAPRIVPKSTMGVYTAARKVRQDIHYAQSLAMSRGIAHGVNFVTAQPYVVYRTDPASPVTDPFKRIPFSENLSDYGDTQVQTTLRLEFDPKGMPVLGGGQNVVLQNGGDTKTIVVAPNTGYVTIQ